MPTVTGKPLMTGFCHNAQHEGTKPRNYKDQPLPVCLGVVHGAFRAIEAVACECACHGNLDKMYAMAEMDRVPQPNPEFVPYKRTFWMPSDDPDYALAINPDMVEGKVVERDRTVELTPTGRTQKGGLEFWVQRECLRWFETAGLGDKEGQCTIKWLSERIGEVENLPPRSPGAIAAVFARWESYGYALIGKKPARFVALTPEGMDKGLDYLKAKAKQ